MKIAAKNLRIKRAYEAASSEDGERFLVDRLWPRGVKKTGLKLAAWFKDVAPSAELRNWFGHKPERWEDFRRRYRAELQSNAVTLQPLRDALAKGVVTLVYSAHDEQHNQAVVLREFLLETPGYQGNSPHSAATRSQIIATGRLHKLSVNEDE